MRHWLLAAGGLLVAVATAAQTLDPATAVEVEPIACYWRTSTDAVLVGETFTLVLTCSVLDAAATTVIPDQSRLDPGVLQLQPFEVRGGEQARDLSTATRRYFQYEYQLRYIGEATGRDAFLPALTLTYRVQSQVQQDGPVVESRERQYVLPTRAIRIESTVPASARDIREVAPVTLADLDARRFRASVLRVVAWALYAVSTLIAAAALVSFGRRRQTKPASDNRHASDAAVLSTVLEELSDVRRARVAGWTDVLAARALTAMRIGASLDAGIPLAQVPVDRGAAPVPGQLHVRAGWTRRAGAMVSGAATPAMLERVSHVDNGATAARHGRMRDLEAALNRLTEAVYGRAGVSREDGLDDALDAGERAIRALRREHSWLAIGVRSLRRWAGGSTRTRGWARS